MIRMLAVVGALLAASNAEAQTRPVIRTQSDLPPTRFAAPLPPSRLMSDDQFLALLTPLRREAERLLRDYDIQDRTLVARLNMGLASIAVLEGRKGDAERLVAAYRADQSQPQGRQIGGLPLDLGAAMTGEAPAERCLAAVARLRTVLAAADASLIRDDFISAAGNFQTAGIPYYASGLEGAIDPVVRQRGAMDVLQGLAIARDRVRGTMLPPCRDVLTRAARAWIDDPAHQPVDIWPGRQPPASAFSRARPVVVAVWDSGFDTAMFPGQMAVDPAEPFDGLDNDANGVVDDISGPTYDTALRPRASVIMPPTRFLQARLAAEMAYDKGESDLRFGLDTREARIFAEFARTASTADQTEQFVASLENRGRVHGTACASEIADGAPYVRLYNVAALPWGRGEDRLEIPYDEATVARWAAAIDRIGARMRGAQVRVVNMSWGLTVDEIAQQLLDRGLETDEGRAKLRGVAMQKTIAEALERLIKGSPNILFVIGAGNSAQPDDIQGDAVTRLKEPNMLIVGATGVNGRPTSFTVFGDSVGLYAQGEAVKLRWPGDVPAYASGTSMAAPLVVRAAAQMLAIRPELSATEVREGLLATATLEQPKMRLLNPASAVAWAARSKSG